VRRTEGLPAPDPKRPWLTSEIERRGRALALAIDRIGNEPDTAVVDQCLGEVGELQALLLRLDAGLRGSKVVELVDRRLRIGRPE
jgi:hypothetical protein